MPANDALLFIDANNYLRLYETDKGKKLLAPLVEQVDYIFVTQQVVSEVQRNKIQVAAKFLREKSKELKPQNFNLPDHLSGTSGEQGEEILQQMRKYGQKIKSLSKEVDALVLGILEQISCSEDEVSKALAPIFAKAVPHSTDELQRARNRKELGNPPGKKNDPIGDQLTWEQIITHFKGKKRLWIISGDSDYGTAYGSKSFLNYFLYDELCKVVSNPEVYLFKDIAHGFEHFVDTTGVIAEKRLTPEEVEEIKNEEKSLSRIELGRSWLSSQSTALRLNELADKLSIHKQIEEAKRQLGGFALSSELTGSSLDELSTNPLINNLNEEAKRHSLTPIHKQPTRGKKNKDKQPPTSPPSSQADDKENKEDKAE